MGLYHVELMVTLTNGRHIRLQVIATTNPESIKDKVLNRLHKTGDQVKEFGKQTTVQLYTSTLEISGEAYERECSEILARVVAESPDPQS